METDPIESKEGAAEPETSPGSEEPEITPLCPNWSNIFGGPTTCIKEGCTRWIPILDPEVRKEAGVDGFCAESLKTSYIEDLALSLGAIAEMMANPTNSEDYGQILEDSKKEKLAGYV